MRTVKQDLDDFNAARSDVFQALSDLRNGRVTPRTQTVLVTAYEALCRIHPPELVDTMTRLFALRHELQEMASKLEAMHRTPQVPPSKGATEK